MTLQKYILLVDLASFIIKLQYLFSSYAIAPPLLALVRHTFLHYRATLLARFAIAEAKTKSLSSGFSESKISSFEPSHHL